ncbi:MAG: TRAP transporter substrate-binding protein DctP [Leptothrix sp. (in: b-proteobacteria)]
MTTPFALLATAAAALLASAGALAADVTMRISHQFPPTHQTAKNLEQFATDVKAATGGKVEVQIFGSEQLYKATQNHAAVARGQVEAAAILNFQWGGTLPDMVVTTIPYLMTSADKLKKFPDSEAARLLDAKMASKGVKNIAWIVDANDGIFTSAKAPLVRPEDFKGVKIRGLSKLFDTGLSAMGASPAAMPGSEVYQALQTGVIDAGLTGVEAAYARRFYEVQKFGVASPLFTAYDNLIVNPAWWNGLPAELRKAIEGAAQKAAHRSLPDTDDIPPELIKQLRDKGMNVTVLNKVQQKAVADVMQPAMIKAFNDSTPDGAKLIELINKL